MYAFDPFCGQYDDYTQLEADAYEQNVALATELNSLQEIKQHLHSNQDLLQTATGDTVITHNSLDSFFTSIDDNDLVNLARLKFQLLGHKNKKVRKQIVIRDACSYQSDVSISDIARNVMSTLVTSHVKPQTSVTCLDLIREPTSRYPLTKDDFLREIEDKVDELAKIGTPEALEERKEMMLLHISIVREPEYIPAPCPYPEPSVEEICSYVEHLSLNSVNDDALVEPTFNPSVSEDSGFSEDHLVEESSLRSIATVIPRPVNSKFSGELPTVAPLLKHFGTDMLFRVIRYLQKSGDVRKVRFLLSLFEYKSDTKASLQAGLDTG